MVLDIIVDDNQIFLFEHEVILLDNFVWIYVYVF